MACALVAAGLLIAGIFSGQWISGGYSETEINLGLRSVEVCLSDICDGSTYGELEGEGLGGARFAGLLALVVGVFTALALLGSVLHQLFARGRHWFIAPTTVAILASAIAMIVGVVALVTLQKLTIAGQAGTGLGFAFYGLGAAAGLVSAIFIGRTPPIDEDQFDPPFAPL